MTANSDEALDMVRQAIEKMPLDAKDEIIEALQVYLRKNEGKPEPTTVILSQLKVHDLRKLGPVGLGKDLYDQLGACGLGLHSDIKFLEFTAVRVIPAGGLEIDFE